MDFSSSTQAAHEQTACQINFAELLRFDELGMPITAIVPAPVLWVK